MIFKKLKAYKDIPGWFSDNDVRFYIKMFKKIPRWGRMAEIGVWKGKSASVICELQQIMKKRISFWAVDTFKGSPEHEDEIIKMGEQGTTLHSEYRRYTKEFRNKGFMKTLVMRSCVAARQFSDEYFDFVFIDANHGTGDVFLDIDDWIPKIKEKGYIAGHDYNLASVQLAVNQYGIPNVHCGTCWYFRKDKLYKKGLGRKFELAFTNVIHTVYRIGLFRLCKLKEKFRSEKEPYNHFDW